MFEGKEVKIILAQSGAGKTTNFMKLIAKDLETKRPEEIAFVTFTRKGAEEGVRRMCNNFMYEPSDLPYFRTLHSLTFHALNLKGNQMFNRIHERKFNKEYGYDLNRCDAANGNVHETRDSVYLDFYDLERSGALTSQMLAEADIELGYYHQLVQKYEEYKSRQCLVDFFDCLIKYVQAGVSLPCKVVYVDECFSPDTKVRMADMSVKAIKDIKAGDYVMGTSGAVKVTNTCHGTDTMYDVVSGKQKILFTCNSKHLIEKYRSHNWLPAENIGNKGRVTFTSIERKDREGDFKGSGVPCRVIKKGIGNYCGITVDSADHCFILANGCIVHNCQDITALQWEVIEKAFSNAEKIYITGDTSQSIYTYSGARPDILLKLARQYPLEYLSSSYRLPRKVFELAKGIVSFISEKIEEMPFDFHEGNPEGTVTQLNSVERLKNFIEEPKENKTEAAWYLLARNKCFLPKFYALLEDNLIPYWTADGFFMGGQIMTRLTDYEGFRLEGYRNEVKKEQFRKKFGIEDFSKPFTDTNLFTEGRKWVYASYIEKYGLEKLKEMCKWNPQILVSTIHYVKGGEAENVAVMLDNTRKTSGVVYKNIDEELRVLYVGVTRTKRNLFLIDSINGQGYDKIITSLKDQFGLIW
nr:MAG TPA: REP HELICASE [Caudoviricetes sp.]